ncbi:MAG: 16S rRNA (adenine(1518)-N(6)/adenine(1519)-N(6))-dimethyltransferase RsmA [Metamycoplasmataceae bacterium]
MDKKYFRKNFGQNFLKDENIIKKIIKEANVKDKDIVEIGPGKGALTFYLIKEAKSLTCYEIDYNLSAFLLEEIKDKKFNLINKDFLKEELNFNSPVDIVSNIPYNITTDILFKIIENIEKINSAILMVQYEVARRMIAKPNLPEYGKLAISLSFYFDIEILFDVPKEAFFPIPKVKSSIIKLTKKTNIDFKIINKDFLNFIKLCFSFKRKTLVNNLKQNYDIPKIIDFLNANNFPENIRAQNMSPQDILKLYLFL